MNQFKNHTATITLDMGNHRQIQCAIKDQCEYHFEVTTWPNHLAITGDMGAFVFSRIPDMFEFCRAAGHPIDHGYWASKLVSQDRNGGATQYSPTLFKAGVTARIEDYIAANNLNKSQERVLWLDIKNEVMNNCDTQEEAIHAALNFLYHEDNPLESITESSFEEYTPRYLWCCDAIQWAIKQYDAAKADQVTLTIGNKEYKCLNIEEASRKYQYLRDLSQKDITQFPSGKLSNGYVVSYSGSIWDPVTTALIMGAAKIEY